jgi:hypothetical protein
LSTELGNAAAPNSGCWSKQEEISISVIELLKENSVSRTIDIENGAFEREDNQRYSRD